MGGFKIGDLNTQAQKIIREKNIDKNRDNLINDDNGELATLLSTTGGKDMNQISNVNFLGQSTKINNNIKKDEYNPSLHKEQLDSFEPTNTKEQQPVTFKEGAKLIGKGFLKQAKGIVTSIFKHPIRTIAAVAGTSLALSALPLIGITATTGASVLALGFAGISLFKIAKDTVQVIKDNKNGNYASMRNNLEKLGGDGLNLAMSLPFVPKAIKQVNRTMKYGTTTIGLNKELIGGLKNIKSVKDIPLEFNKANLKINYEMIAKEMGLKIKPELVFKNMNPQLAGAYEPASGTMEINELYLKPGYKTLAKLNKLDNEALLRHELEHFKQFSDIVRSEEYGVVGLKEVLKRYYGNMESINKFTLKQSGINLEAMENILKENGSRLNSEFYESIIKETGTIAKGTQEAAKAREYATGMISKSDPVTIQQTNEAINSANGLFNKQKAMLNEYKKNILEKEAYAAQEVYVKNVENMRPSVAGDNIRLIAHLENSDT